VSAASFRKSQAEFGADYVRTDRDNEYMVVSRVTRMLQNARDHGDQFAIIRAVHTNTELWTALAADLASPGNALPDQLKAGLISLAIFSVQHGRKVMADNASIEPLLEINMRIMKGLRGEVQE
jgi:flagellar protein FlaF